MIKSLLLLVALLTAGTLHAQQPAARITVTVLGSGTPVPSRTQAGPAILVEAGAERLLFDCGRGCTTRLAALDPALTTRVDTLFLTHLHSDHVVGVPDLWLNGWTQGRNRPLRVWGPPGAAAMIDGLRTAYAADIGYRVADGVPADAAGLARSVVEVPARGGVVYDAGGVRVTAFAVAHGALPAFGYRIDHGGRSVVISGDTGPSPALTAAARGADLVLLEVLSPGMEAYVRRSFAPAQADRIARLHLTTAQAADVLRAAAPGLGVFYHMVGGCEPGRALLAATRAAYPGRVVVARDLIRLHVGERVEVDQILTSTPQADDAGCT